jgi:hypothetical protein
LATTQSLSSASAKTECRKVMTFRTVFGASPRLSIARASRSTSSRLTVSTRRLPSAGETWTRCIDSQFCLYDSRAPSMSRRPRSSSATSSTVGGRCSGALGGRRASASISRRKPRSASVRVRPSDSPRARILPMRRLTRRPSGDVQRP